MRQATKRKSRARPLIADVSGSKCFSDLRWSKNQVFATFARDGSSYSYPMSRKEAKAWFGAESLGQYFDENIR